MELLGDDLTAARFQKSVIRKRLHKTSTVTLGEKVNRKLERREQSAGRKVQRRQHDDRMAISAISTLCSLDGEELLVVVRRAGLLCGEKNAGELNRVAGANDPINRALHFLYRIVRGSQFEIDALRRNEELDRALGIWMEKADRILRRDKRALERKVDEKQTIRKKLRSKLS